MTRHPRLRASPLTTKVWLVCAIAASLSLVSACGFAADASREVIKIDGKRRNYLLYTPRSVDTTKSHPLVLVMHGGGGAARGLYRDTRKSFTALADRHGIYLAYPNAVRRMWDFGAGKVSEELKVRTDDREFFKQLLEHLTGTLPIDQRRVFATGISRGGQASYFLACQFPQRIRAIAPIAMPMPAFMVAGCKATPDIGLALLNGTNDPIVPYAGGQIVARGRERGRVLSTNATLKLWRERNGCTSKPTAKRKIDPVADDTSVERSDWTLCRGAPVRLYRISGGGHTWPSGSQYMPKRVVGSVTRDIDGVVEAWDFFSTFE